MKILHCCLAAFYIDGYGYQENIFPRAHKNMGHVVEIVASTETYVDGSNRGYTNPSTYLSEDGIPVTRLAYIGWLPNALARKLRLYEAFQAKLDEFRPDVVFLHDLQFLDIWRVRKYARATGARVYVDSHTDGINSAKGFVSRTFLHGIIYRFCAKVIEPVTTFFYPTLPLRMQFMQEVYGLGKERMRLLPFGVDDVLETPVIDSDERRSLRLSYGIQESEVVLVAGGKIDARKNILNLLRGFGELRSGLHIDVKLLLFGTPDEDCAQEYRALVDQPGVVTAGWLTPREITHLLQGADLAVFPGTHSVLWEEAVGLGIPCVFKRWKGIEHVDIGGNCIFIDDSSSRALIDVLHDLLSNERRFSSMTAAARSPERNKFTYSHIAASAIDPR